MAIIEPTNRLSVAKPTATRPMSAERSIAVMERGEHEGQDVQHRRSRRSRWPVSLFMYLDEFREVTFQFRERIYSWQIGLRVNTGHIHQHGLDTDLLCSQEIHCIDVSEI